MGTFSELHLSQGNDETLQFTVSVAAGTALNLATVAALELFLKPTAQTIDTDPAVTKLTMAAGDIVITDPVNGVCLATVQASVLTTAGVRWWRLDAVLAGKRKTVLYGPLRVTDT